MTACDVSILVLRALLGLTIAAHGYNKFVGRGGIAPDPRRGGGGNRGHRRRPVQPGLRAVRRYHRLPLPRRLVRDVDRGGTRAGRRYRPAGDLFPAARQVLTASSPPFATRVASGSRTRPRACVGPVLHEGLCSLALSYATSSRISRGLAARSRYRQCWCAAEHRSTSTACDRCPEGLRWPAGGL